MYVENVSLSGFRNYDYLSIGLSERINIVKGDNAQGKTNFLEAVYFCAAGRSKRTHSDRELIQFNRGEAHIQAHIVKNGTRDRIDVHLRKDGSKGIALNGLAVKKVSDMFGALYAVIFSPEDLNLIKEGPAERRKFLDLEICQTNRLYYSELTQYHKILRQRNNLLKTLQKNKGGNSELKETVFAWDAQLVAHGVRIMRLREDFIVKIDEIAGKIHRDITNGKETLSVQYKPSVSQEDFAEKLKRGLERDIQLGSTSYGIHKDDLNFLINGVDARIFGSQGQQRTAALSCKLSEIKFIEEQKAERAVLLLDDVFSELDATRQRYLIENMEGSQTVITCTGAETAVSELQKLPGCACFSVSAGVITK